MNTPCPSWTERLSLLAADCLPADEAELVRRHAAACIGCGVRLLELESLGEMLFAARSDASASTVAILDRIDKAIAADHKVSPGKLPLDTNSVAGAAWIAVATAGIALGLFLGFAWWLSGSPHGGATIVKDAPPVNQGAEPIVALRERPTLLDFQRAANVSDEKLEALLREDASHITFGGPAPRLSSSSLLLDAMP